VRSFSPGPWATFAGSIGAPPFAFDEFELAALELAVLVPEDEDPVAAPAIWDPARMPPASSPAPISPAAPSQRLGRPALVLSFASICMDLLLAAPAAPRRKGMLDPAPWAKVRET